MWTILQMISSEYSTDIHVMLEPMSNFAWFFDYLIWIGNVQNIRFYFKQNKASLHMQRPTKQNIDIQLTITIKHKVQSIDL